MDKEDKINKVLGILQTKGLTDGRRKLLNDKEVSTIIDLISDSDWVAPNQSVNIFDIFSHFKYPKFKIAFVNKHARYFQEEWIERLEDSDKGFNIKPAFFKHILEAIEEEERLQSYSEDETEDEKQGFIYLSPRMHYNEFITKFERTFAISSNTFANDKVFLRNIDSFLYVHNKIDYTKATQYPKKYRIVIEREMTVAGVNKPLKYSMLYKGYKYEYYNHQLAGFSGSKGVLPNGFVADDKPPTIPAGKLMGEAASEMMEYHVYEARLLFDDDTSEEILVESYIPLRQTYYEGYGYTRRGTVSKRTHIKIFQIVEDLVNQIKIEQIFPQKKHAFLELYDFIFEYINGKKIPFKKKRSDTLIWIEVLKLMIQFSGFDPDRKTHSIYAGFQDVGKSYIVGKFNSIKFANVKTVESSNMTGPGLFGAASRNLLLPDEKIEGVPEEGAFASDAVFMEEIGRAIRDRGSIFNERLEAFKLALFSRTVEILKSGGGTQPRNAYAIMTMNYDKEWTDSLRKVLARTMEGVESEWNQNKLQIGEDTKNLLGEDGQVQSAILLELCRKYDIFLPFDDYHDDEFEFNNRIVSRSHARVFKKAIERFRELYSVIDIHTGLPNAFLKRTIFSLYGSTAETRTDDDYDENYSDNTTDLTTSEVKKDKDLYIPNLRQVMEDYILGNAKAAGYFDSKTGCTKRINKIAYEVYHIITDKYPKFKEKFGDNTTLQFIGMILATLMFANKEDKPSVQTLQLIEKWAYLQCTAITSSEARNYRHLEKRIDYIFTDKTYKTYSKRFD